MDEFVEDVGKKSAEEPLPQLPRHRQHNNYLRGYLSRYHILDYRNKQVILVDHNEYAQSVKGVRKRPICWRSSIIAPHLRYRHQPADLLPQCRSSVPRHPYSTPPSIWKTRWTSPRMWRACCWARSSRIRLRLRCPSHDTQRHRSGQDAGAYRRPGHRCLLPLTEMFPRQLQHLAEERTGTDHPGMSRHSRSILTKS